MVWYGTIPYHTPLSYSTYNTNLRESLWQIPFVRPGLVHIIPPERRNALYDEELTVGAMMVKHEHFFGGSTNGQKWFAI